MQKRFLLSSICLVVIGVASLSPVGGAQSRKSSTPTGPLPDRAYLQKIWDTWATLDPAQQAQFHAQGPNTFYDESPLKYNSWDEYEKGVKGVLAGYKTAKFTVNGRRPLQRQLN